MDREKIQSFTRAAEAGLASVRGGLLVTAQSGDASNIATAQHEMRRLKDAAAGNGLLHIEELAAEGEAALTRVGERKVVPPAAVYAVLDTVARIEAAIFNIPLGLDDFLDDIPAFVEASFNGIVPQQEFENGTGGEAAAEKFEIDEETLDIFRSEAEELLTNISNDLQVLSDSSSDQNAIWNIRRNAHTFKGAAGIVGLSEASAIAHRMEDLLDKLVEMRREAAGPIVGFLNASSVCLNQIVAAQDLRADGLDESYNAAVAWLAAADRPAGSEIPANSAAAYVGPNADPSPSVRREIPKQTPIVRVSLDRLDEILKLSRSLLVNGSAVAERVSESGTKPAGETTAKLSFLLNTQRQLMDEIHTKLLKIRMVRFGTLETRLSRAVQVTAIDEQKKAAVRVENGDVEIDTQIMDALIEPLLHLLKNAVVHGIEPPDTRRLLGKPEKGVIAIRIEVDADILHLSVTDDGGGISIPKLKGKAAANGVIGVQAVSQMADRDALNLIFDRGLTTADKVDMNAGRGVGMSIVKESVESRGGSVNVESRPQVGTRFTIRMPLAAEKRFSMRDNHLDSRPILAMDHEPLVLIIDDSSSIRLHNSRIAQDAGFRVITAVNGAEALEKLGLDASQPHLILSDVEMPQMDGWEFLTHAKADANLGSIPVVMVTSLDSGENRQRAYDLGATDYIVKPLTLQNLKAVAERLFAEVVRS
jgi:two-component system chemotaxis sensor kinase CheA